MKKITYALAGLFAMSSVALAGTPAPLTDEALDEVTAGFIFVNTAVFQGIGSQNSCVALCIGGVNGTNAGQVF